METEKRCVYVNAHRKPTQLSQVCPEKKTHNPGKQHENPIDCLIHSSRFHRIDLRVC